MFRKKTDPAENTKTEGTQDEPLTEEEQAQRDREEFDQMQSRTKYRRTIWGLAGIYLLYLAYSLFKNAREDDFFTWYVVIAIIIFVVGGGFLLFEMLRFYFIKPDLGKEGEEQPKEPQKPAAPVPDERAQAAKKLQQEQMTRAGAGISCKAVILAAGKGTRMHSDLPKVLHEIDEKPMALYVKEAACEAGAQVVCYVIGYQKDQVRIALADRGVTFAVQEEQLGTGHAVKCAKNFIGTQGDVFVLCGDTPLITGRTLRQLLDRHRLQGNAVTALSAMLDDPFGYGRIIRDEYGNFVRSVEEKDATEEERQIRESNVGMYVFRAADLSEAVELLDNDNAQGEYYLPDTLKILKDQGKQVDAYCIDNTPEVLGVNTPEQLEEAARILHARNA